MTNNVDLTKLACSLQGLVVRKKDDKPINSALTHLNHIADVLAKRNAAIGVTANSAIINEDNSKQLTKGERQGGLQLNRLNEENEQLRDFHEDIMWTMHLLMETHRKAVLNLCERDKKRAEEARKNIELVPAEDHLKEQIPNVVTVADKILDRHCKNHERLLEGCQTLTVHNQLLREILSMDFDEFDSMDAEKLLERIECKTPVPTPASNSSKTKTPEKTEDHDSSLETTGTEANETIIHREVDC